MLLTLKCGFVHKKPECIIKSFGISPLTSYQKKFLEIKPVIKNNKKLNKFGMTQNNYINAQNSYSYLNLAAIQQELL